MSQVDAGPPGDYISELRAIPGARADTSADDHAFVDQLRNRDESAWEPFFDHYFERIYRYALARLGHASRAEDVAATTFQRALSGISRYRHQGKPLVAWLYGIASNVLKEEQRAMRRNGGIAFSKDVADRWDELMGLAVPDTTDRSIALIDLAEALERLTESQREVILLRYFSGLSGGEAALVLGRAETAIYALQARALAALRRELS